MEARQLALATFFVPLGTLPSILLTFARSLGPPVGVLLDSLRHSTKLSGRLLKYAACLEGVITVAANLCGDAAVLSASGGLER
jgi:hypothetical protein